MWSQLTSEYGYSHIRCTLLHYIHTSTQNIATSWVQCRIEACSVFQFKMSDHDDRYPGGEFWSNEEDDGDNSDSDSFNGEDEEINVDSYEFLGSLICQDEDELNSTDSVFRSVGFFLYFISLFLYLAFRYVIAKFQEWSHNSGAKDKV